MKNSRNWSRMMALSPFQSVMWPPYMYGPFSEPVEDLSIGGYFTSDQVIAEYTDAEPDILEQTTLPRLRQEHHRGSLQQIIDISVDTGLINEPIE